MSNTNNSPLSSEQIEQLKKFAIPAVVVVGLIIVSKKFKIFNSRPKY